MSRSDSRCSAPDAPAATASASARPAVSSSGARATWHWKRALAIAVLAGLSAVTSGCYLAHLASGQTRLLRARVPVETVISRPDTPEELRERLERVAEARDFAADLGLDVGDRYTSYVEWPGDFVVVSVVATRPGEVEPVTSWFPLVGSVPYRGYFDPDRAEARVDELRESGLDVCKVKVRAYSTLGWFDDPLTGPMVRQDESDLVETVFHELLHATVFVSGEADFNEGVAAFVGQEARVRFYAARDPSGIAGERERRRVTQARRLRAEILTLRRAVESLYARTSDPLERGAGRARLEAETRRRIAALELDDRDPAELAAELQLNDACLALSGTYHADTVQLGAALDALDGDLAAFVAAVERAAASDDPRGALLGDAAASPAAAASR